MGLTLAELRARKEARKAHLMENLDSISRQLRDLGATMIILHGSLARGNVNSHSDLDLLCIMPATKSGREWSIMIYDEVNRSVDCDIIVFNEEELRRDLPVNRFLRMALETGTAVYERSPKLSGPCRTSL